MELGLRLSMSFSESSLSSTQSEGGSLQGVGVTASHSENVTSAHRWCSVLASGRTGPWIT